MAYITDDLEALFEQVRVLASGIGAVLYPSLPVEGSLAEAPFPDEDGLDGYVDLVRAVAPALVYIQQYKLSETDIDKIHEAADPAAVEQAIATLGASTDLVVGFATEGVLHTWRAETAWWSELRGHLHATVYLRQIQRRADLDQQRTTANNIYSHTNEWAAQLAHAPAFLAARNDTERRAAARTVLPQLSEHLDDLAQGPARHAAGHVVTSAAVLARNEVKPRLLAEATDRVEEWAQVLHDDVYARATTKPERLRLAREFIAGRLGFSDTKLAAQLERAANEVRRPSG